MNINERNVLKAVLDNALDASGGDFGFSDEVIANGVEGLSKNQIKGYLSSIQAKGLIFIDDEMGQIEFNKTTLQTMIGTGLVNELYTKQFEVWYY